MNRNTIENQLKNILLHNFPQLPIDEIIKNEYVILSPLTQIDPISMVYLYMILEKEFEINIDQEDLIYNHSLYFSDVVDLIISSKNVKAHP